MGGSEGGKIPGKKYGTGSWWLAWSPLQKPFLRVHMSNHPSRVGFQRALPESLWQTCTEHEHKIVKEFRTKRRDDPQHLGPLAQRLRNQKSVRLPSLCRRGMPGQSSHTIPGEAHSSQGQGAEAHVFLGFPEELARLIYFEEAETSTTTPPPILFIKASIV